MPIEQDGWQAIVSVIHLYRDLMRITEQRLGMSQTRFEIMHELHHVEEMSQADLQQHLGVEGAVITRIVKQLEAAGLVTRRADPRDNRFTLVALSAMAREGTTGEEGTDYKDTFGADIMQGLSEEERAQFLQSLERIRANAEALRTSKPSTQE